MVIRNVVHVQECLGRQLLLENPSTYLELPQSVLTEGEFLAELTLRTGCGVLLDLNNLFVSASNRGDDAGEVLQHFLEVIPEEAIREIHLAGHRLADSTQGRDFRIDDHGSPVCSSVWDLYAQAIQELGPVPTLIEWDSAIPPFQTLQREARAAQSLLEGNVSEEWRRAVAS